MKKSSSIVYVNFSPYDNAGRILDYVIKNFNIVIHFSYDHLRLKKGRRSKLSVYENGRLVFKKNLIWLRTRSLLLFPSLPFVAFFIMIQSFWYIAKFKKKYGKFDIYLTVNAFTAWNGNIFRMLGLVKKTIFWVWDYFPIDYPDWRLKLARWVYWRFDKPTLKSSDKTVFLNKQLKTARKNHDKSLIDKKYLIVPIGTIPINNIAPKKKIIIGHMGMLKKGQGLDLLFGSLDSLLKIIPKLKVEIIGSGPEDDYFKRRARKLSKIVKFYGYIENDNDVDHIISRWGIGVATYMPAPWSEHYFTDPSKIKAYLSLGTPVITTSVSPFSKEIKRYKAGIVIDYNKEEFINAAIEILRRHSFYSKNALLLAKKYYYKKLYPKLFTF